MLGPKKHLTRVASGLWILVATLAAHGLLPFLTIIVSDDWFTLLAYHEASVSAAWKGAVFLSIPLTIIQALPFFVIGDNLPVLRLINLFLVYGLGLMIFMCLDRLRPSARRESLWVSIFMVVFPGYLVHFMVSFVAYQLGFFLFLAGFWISLKADNTNNGRRRNLLLCIACMIVFYSFHFGALLVFYPLFVLGQFGYWWSRGQTGFKGAVVHYFKRFYLYLLLPFWFWGMRQSLGLFLPVWTAYNDPAFDGERVSRGLGGFARSYGEIFFPVVASPWLYMALVTGVAVVLIGRSRGAESNRTWRSLAGVVVGVVILILGILPFMLVGKTPQLSPIDPRGLTAFDYATQQILVVIDRRMHLFLGFGLGLILANAVPWICARLRLRQGISGAVLVALTFSCVVEDNAYYLHLERQWLSMAGVREWLKVDPLLKQVSIFGVIDRIGCISTTWDSWVLFFQTVWGERDHYGIPERWYGRRLNAALIYQPGTVVNKQLYGGAWYGYMKPPARPCREATLVLSPGEAYYSSSDAAVVGRYIYDRLFEKNEVSAYLKRFARITVIPKRNLDDEITKPGFARDWYTLDEVPETLLSASNGWSSPGAALTTFETRTQDNDGGRCVFVEFDVADTPASSWGFRLMDASNKELPAWLLVSGNHVRLVGTLTVATKTVSVAPSSEPQSRPLKLRNIIVKQESWTDEKSLTILGAPYLDPRYANTQGFLGAYDLDHNLMPAILRVEGPAPRKPVYDCYPELQFHPDNKDQSLSTDFIDVWAGRRILVRLDWGQATPKIGARVCVRNERNQLVQALDCPPNGGIHIYEVVPIYNSSLICFCFASATGNPVLLPRHLSCVQIDNVLPADGTIEQAFKLEEPLPTPVR